MDTVIYEKRGPDDKHGWLYLWPVRGKTPREVYQELVKELLAGGHAHQETYGGGSPVTYVHGAEEYFSLGTMLTLGDRKDQEPIDYTQVWRWVVFPVTGGSEGHYVHVGWLDKAEHRLHTIILGKTFMGMDGAWELCKAIAKILEV